MSGLHVTILLATVVAILWSDHMGLAYMRGTTQTLNPIAVRRLHYAVWAGLIGMIITGIIMVAPAWGFFATDPVFWTKMFFVGVLVLNSFFIHSVMHVATTTPFAQLTNGQKTKLVASGAASAIGWLGAIIIGMFFL
jgi:hypothetical protein